MPRATLSAAIAFLAWSLSCNDNRSPEDLQSADDLRRALLQIIPRGTPRDSARLRMERNGFRCDIRSWEGKSNPVLFCDKEAIGFPCFFDVTWWTVHDVEDGRTASVFVHKGTGCFQ